MISSKVMCCPACGQSETVRVANYTTYLVRRQRSALIVGGLVLGMLVLGTVGAAVGSLALASLLGDLGAMLGILAVVLLPTLALMLTAYLLLPPPGVRGYYYCQYCEGFFLPARRQLIPAGRVRTPLDEAPV